MNTKGFLLNPAITQLNHGSFGGCTTEIFDDYQYWQRLLEFEPVQFITKTGFVAIKKAREALGEFVGANAQDIVFTPNPTFAINILRDSLKLAPGDEILTTNLEYGAMDRTWTHYCKEHGTKLIRQEITLPLTTVDHFLSEFWKGYSDKTKVVFISEITSITALKLPVKQVVTEAKKRGLLVIVDGAHSPAHIDINLEEMQPDFYTGACHKWMQTPKGSSFLWARKDRQAMLEPLVVSWGYEAEYPGESQFLDHHQFNGTRDFSAYLTIPKAIEVLHKNNYKQKSKESTEVLLKNADKFIRLLNSKALAPLNDTFIGHIISFPIKTSDPIELKRVLYEDFKIEIPVMKHGDQVYLRISYFWYNEQKDLDALEQALEEITSNRLKYKNLIQIN